jgi:hypothetical protein
MFSWFPSFLFGGNQLYNAMCYAEERSKQFSKIKLDVQADVVPNYCETIYEKAAQGNLDLVKEMLLNGSQWCAFKFIEFHKQLVNQVGVLSGLEEFIENPFEPRIIDDIIEHSDQVEVLKWAHGYTSKYCPKKWKLDDIAATTARKGKLEFLKYIVESAPDDHDWSLLPGLEALRAQQAICLKYLAQQGIHAPHDAIEIAITFDNPECFKIVVEDCIYFNPRHVQALIDNNFINCFKYVIECYNVQQILNKVSPMHEEFVDKIDLDDPVFRKFFDTDLSKHECLQQKVVQKIHEIKEYKKVLKNTLTMLPSDLIEHVVFLYI